MGRYKEQFVGRAISKKDPGHSQRWSSRLQDTNRHPSGWAEVSRNDPSRHNQVRSNLHVQARRGEVNQRTVMRATVGSWSLALVLMSPHQLLTWTCSTNVPRFAIALERKIWSWNRFSPQTSLSPTGQHLQVVHNSGRKCRCSAQRDPLQSSRQSRLICHRMGQKRS